MALQGTLDTFALADLVRLLATTEKTGALAIDGDRGQGRLWFAAGDLVGGEPAPDGDVVDALFALLRMEEGDFRFDADEQPEHPGDARRALDALESAEERLEAWKPVEALVPSPAVTVTLRAELEGDEVRLDRDTWRRLVAVASVSTAADLASALGLDDVATAFALRDLVDAGLVEVGAPVEDTTDDLDGVDEPDVVAAAAASPVDDVFVPVEIEDIPLPGEEEALAVREARAAAAAAAAADDDAETTSPAEADVAAWSAIDPVPTLSTAAELLASADTEGLDAPSLGPWESLGAAGDDTTAPDLDAPVDDEAPATLAEALPPIDDGLPSLDAAEPRLEDATPATEAPAPAGSLPSLDGPVPGSLAVDLDAQLGGSATDHSYLDRATGSDVLPEPLPSAPAAGAEAVPGDPSVDPDPDRAPWPAPQGGSAEDDHQLDSLSPAAAAAVATAANDGGAEEVEAGRRVLRRIISTGKG